MHGQEYQFGGVPRGNVVFGVRFSARLSALKGAFYGHARHAGKWRIMGFMEITERFFAYGASIAECLDEAYSELVMDILNPVTAKCHFTQSERYDLTRAVRAVLVRVAGAAGEGADAGTLTAALFACAAMADLARPEPEPYPPLPADRAPLVLCLADDN
jgi:hypothetical protein